MNNQKIQQLDMSCSQIEELPSNTTDTTGLFYMSNNLTYLYLPKNLKVIGERAFYKLSGLAELILPNTLTTIGRYAFTSTAIKNGQIRVPGSVKEIQEYSFFNLGVRTVYLEEGVEVIKNMSFLENNSLNLYIPNSIKSIGFQTFFNIILVSNNISIFVKTEEMKNKIISSGLKGISNASIKVQNWQ